MCLEGAGAVLSTTEDLAKFVLANFNGDNDLKLRPSNPKTVKIHQGLQSPAERLNQKNYHPNWLQNLHIAVSLGGYRTPPQNPG